MLRVFKSFYTILWENGEKEALEYGVCTRSLPVLSEENIESEIWDIKNFESAYDFFCKHPYFYKYCSMRSLFFNKPIIHTYEGDNITIKNFVPFKVVKYYEDVTDKVSIKNLANDLTADDFCRFLKDRQINFNLELTR